MAEVRTLMTGIVFGEQPRWHDDRLWFADCGTREVIALDLEGRSEVVLRVSSFPCCVDWLPFAPGVVALVRPDGSVHRAAEGLSFPNGMLVTPDNGTLIVAESYAKRLSAYGISADGTLRNRRVWADLGDGVPDGICLDAEGAVWYGDVPNKRCVRVREGGEVLQTIELDRGCFACALGGPDRSTLLMIATEWHGPAAMLAQPHTGQVLAAPAPGVGWP